MITSQQLLNILPIKDELRQQLKSEWETMDPNEKFEVESALWDAYYDLYQIRLDKNIEKKMAEIQAGNGQLSPEFYTEVKEATEKELQSEEITNVDSAELVDVRNKLQKLIH